MRTSTTAGRLSFLLRSNSFLMRPCTLRALVMKRQHCYIQHLTFLTLMVGADAALWMASLSKLLARARLDCAGGALALASRAHLYNIAALNPFLVVIDM
jgi:hypothetical protein